MLKNVQVKSQLIGSKGNAIINNALNTFYLWLYGIEHNYGKRSFRQRTPVAITPCTIFEQQPEIVYMHHPIGRIVYIPAVEHWLLMIHHTSGCSMELCSNEKPVHVYMPQTITVIY